MSPRSYSVDNAPRAITDLIVTHIRVVAHTMGPVAPGAQLSQNHWSIYLVHSQGSVRLNMQLRDARSNSTRGLLTVTNYPYTSVSNSAVRSWEFGVTTNLAVYYVLQAIIDKGRANYDMTEGGVGCRYWISVVMSDWRELNYVSSVSTDGATLENVIAYNYSIGMEPVYLEIKQGTFLQNAHYPAPIASSSSAYSAYAAPIASTSYSATTYPGPSAAYSQPVSNTVTLDDNDYITATRVKTGRDTASSVYRFRTAAGFVEKRGDQFYEATHQNGSSCMVYYGVNSQRYYWTWTLG